MFKRSKLRTKNLFKSNKFSLNKIMVILDNLFREVNPFYFAFKNMRGVEIAEHEKARTFGYPIPTVIMLI